MKAIIKNHLVLTGIIIFLSSCNTQEKNPVILSAKAEKELNYLPTVLPKDTTNLWIGEGDMNSDTAFIVIEGGPHNKIYFQTNGIDIWSALPDYYNYYRVHLHQVNGLNPSIYNWKHEFTHDMGELEVNNETEALARTINYFKSRNKKVILAGTSWGAILIPYYLTKYGNNVDKIIISAGRLDSDPMQVKYFLKGYNSKFLHDGKTMIFPDTTRVRNPNRGEYYHKISRVKQFMKAALGKYKFTEELADMDLSNVVYAYATNDPQIGALTQKELDFLKSKNVPVYTSDQGHAGPDRVIIQMVKEGKIKL
ncbi:hypothetical protein [Winogradskyella haliclonae]|uniref:Alpha/beta hydrolase n=1 Tax=Winogradskyella haliclonae TaxID=2048558 RepID=A0ABQ2C1D0_9FLAO|nr:hypothetical protein [Winogradskyella haliclonae]GGI57582.1 hypothetical protein GCM10011444_18910 [Winogradskyella haliclonae]